MQAKLFSPPLGIDGLDWMCVGTRTHIVDRIGLGQSVCGLRWIGSSKTDPHFML